MVLKSKGLVRGFRSICCGVFDISKFCGIFPFRVTHSKIHRVLPNLIASIIVMVISVYVATWHWNDHLHFIYKINHDKAVQKVLIIPYLGLALTPFVSIIWMTLSVKKFSKIINALLKVEHVTFFYPEKMKYYMLSLMLTTQLMILFYGSYHFGLPYYKSPIMYMFHVFYLLDLLVTQQFTAILICIRGHYNFLLNTLNKNNAEMWTQCHEILGSCCNAISECYAPPLLLFFLSTFVLTVCNVFIIVLRIKSQDTSGLFFYILCAAVPSYAIWYILFNCRDSLMKVSISLPFIYYQQK